jgi:hypothetical protein
MLIINALSDFEERKEAILSRYVPPRGPPPLSYQRLSSQFVSLPTGSCLASTASPPTGILPPTKCLEERPPGLRLDRQEPKWQYWLSKRVRKI